MTPENLEAERAVLAAPLIDQGLLASAAAILTPADFARTGHRAIFAAELRAEAAGQVDLVTVRNQLERQRELEAAGGAAYLAGLVEGLPRIDDRGMAHWAGIVKERSRVRFLGVQLDRLRTRAAAADASADELQAAISDLALDREATGAGILDREDLAKRTWRLIDDEIAGRATGITTGLPSLDRRLRFGGWRPGQVVYVGARTSRGKSALLLAMAEAAAATSRRVLLFPLEMTPEELGVRRLVAEAGVGLRSVFAWQAAEREQALARMAAVTGILERPLDFAHPAVRTLTGIRAECRRAKARGLDLVVIDYLGLIRDHKARRESSLYERTTVISQSIKALAMELEVPVLCAVQLNREPAGARPSLAHFRDSGAIEQDCDVALLVHQADTVDAIRQGWVELIVAKQRNGWTGDVRLWWNAACARFEDRTGAEESVA